MNKLKQLIMLCALATVAHGVFASNTTAGWRGSVPGLGRLYMTELEVGTLEVTSSLNVDEMYSTSVVLLNNETIANGTDGVITVTADDNASEVLDVQWRSSNTSIDDAQTLRHSFWGPNSTGNQTEFAYIELVYDDVTTATEDGSLKFGVVTNDTLAAELLLTGAVLRPNAEGGLTLGATGYGWGNAYFNGTITATTGTATFGAVVVNTSLIPDTDGGATLGASGTGIGNTFIDGNLTASTGTATFGAVVLNTSLTPDTDGGATLGAAGTGIGNVYIDGTITATTSTATFGAAVINTSLVPDADGGATFGASGTGWGNAYFDGTITATSGTATFGAVVVNTSLVPDADGGATFGAAGTGWGNAYFNGTVTTTGSLTIGNTDAIVGIRHGQITIANAATSGTVALTDIDADDAVILCANESLSTAVVYAKIEAGLCVDAVLVDVNGGDATCNATSEYTISYIAILD